MNATADHARTASTPLPRAFVDGLLALPATATLKSDDRSRVWRVVDAEGRPWVVKRFEPCKWRYWLAARVGLHPAQREVRVQAHLRALAVPVVSVSSLRFDTGGRALLVSPDRGVSVYNWLKRLPPDACPAKRHAVARQLGQITGQLIEHGFAHDDHKASNIVMDSDGVLRLIDVGGVRRTRSRRRIRRMLESLGKNLSTAATRHADPASVRLTRADRLRFYRAMISQVSTPIPWLKSLASHPDGV